MTAQPTALVWYAAFGSNLDQDRFSCYLSGGRPLGGRMRQPGCRDPQPPRHSVPAELPYQLYFAGRSATWGGGVAYLDHAHTPTAGTLARLYLITTDQFVDVVAQECGGHRLAGPIDMEQLIAFGSMTAVAGLYGHLLHPGCLDRIPIVTCTSPEPLVTRTQRPPSTAYRQTIVRGLTQIRPDLDQASIDDYLDARIVEPHASPDLRHRPVGRWPFDDQWADPHPQLDGWDDPATWDGHSFATRDDLEALGWDWASAGDTIEDAARINDHLERISWLNNRRRPLAQM